MYECVLEDGNIHLKWHWNPTECEVKDKNGKVSKYRNGEEFLYQGKSISLYYKCVIKNRKVDFEPVACYYVNGKQKILPGQSVKKGKSMVNRLVMAQT